MLPFPRGNPPEPILRYYFWPTTPDTVRPAGQVIFYFSFLGFGAAVWAQHISLDKQQMWETRHCLKGKRKLQFPDGLLLLRCDFPEKTLFFFYKLHQMSWLKLSFIEMFAPLSWMGVWWLKLHPSIINPVHIDLFVVSLSLEIVSLSLWNGCDFVVPFKCMCLPI